MTGVSTVDTVAFNQGAIRTGADVGRIVMRRRGLIASTASLLFAPAIARAQAAWPNRQVRFIVPFPPGGGTDTIGRIIADQLGKTFGQTFVVDNRGGAGGTVGTVELARAAPDGYTVGMITVGSHGIHPTLYAKLAYDPYKDFTPISMFASLPNLLALHPSVPAKTVAELIALLKKEPGKYTFCSSGSGTSLHLSGELFKQMTGVDMLHVPYKGGAPAVLALLNGEVQMTAVSANTALPHITSGKLLALGVAAAKRSPALPDVPTFAESDIHFDGDSWLAIMGPAGIPADIAAALNREIAATLNVPETRERLAKIGLSVVASSPADLAEMLRGDVVKWGKVVKDSGAVAD
jgi:tripartite-type tricarboxylate transporter receptor subunit TctC